MSSTWDISVSNIGPKGANRDESNRGYKLGSHLRKGQSILDRSYIGYNMALT
ncbi:hypothetical protein DPMN_058467 [Dreissena polymorpha]|uniref:Uncharacterized protein n=1 Tax=Dreissena polymorpha TaxID=45954 RepID=A0A9D4C276_DREPO|nr:hypothetical protein DPMN_058467 [Dreissena polymorpha]